VVADLADRMTIMKDGTVVESGETGPLLQTLNHPYSRMLMEASTHQPDRLASAVREEVPLLSVERVTRTYPLPRPSIFAARPTFTAVNGVSFEISEGESVGLVGESGCGKSTLARTLLALDAPQGGSVHLAGADLFALEKADMRARRRDVQVVFQDPYGSFNPRHRVERLVAEPLALYDPPLERADRRQRVVKAMESVGLSASDVDKYPHEFSGGQRQRLAIARAIITEPKLIVADEPVSALDVSIRAQVLDLFADLQARLGLSLLFISHDLTVVRSITDRVLVMKDGEIVETGVTSDVFDDPQHPYTRALLKAAPNLAASLERRGVRQPGDQSAISPPVA
ncbi:MAG: ATP-binding cassette domain-containing protein, partial [Pseudomonadota bacterium]